MEVKMEKGQNEVPIISIPKGMDIENYIDMDDSEYFDEPPIKEAEVKIKFE